MSRQRVKKSPIEIQIDEVYQQVGEFMYEAFGDSYPHFNITVGGMTIYIECGKKREDWAIAEVAADTFGDLLYEAKLQHLIQLR